MQLEQFRRVVLDIDETLVSCFLEKGLKKKEKELFDNIENIPELNGRFFKRNLIDCSERHKPGTGNF